MNEEIINNATYRIVTKRDQILKDTIIQKHSIYFDVEEARKVMKDVKHITSRKNPRIEYYWNDSMGNLMDYSNKNVK